MATNATLPGTLRMPDDDDPLISLREARRRGFPHPNTLRRYIREGKLPGQRMGKQFMVRESHLKRILQPVLAPGNPEASVSPPDYEELSHVTATLVASWPRLSEQKQAELKQLLAV